MKLMTLLNEIHQTDVDSQTLKMSNHVRMTEMFADDSLYDDVCTPIVVVDKK